MVNSKENETRPRNRRQNGPREKWSERVIQISRVTKVCKGGKKLSFRAVVIIGNENGQVGVGVGKAEDVINAITLAFDKGENKGVIQIGPNKCTRINDLAKVIIDQMDSNIKIVHDLSKPIGDIGRCANYNKAKELLGWEPTISLEDGVSDLVEWLKIKTS